MAEDERRASARPADRQDRAPRAALPVDTLAFPTAAIPASAKTPAVEKPMVYAIARQESAFNPGAVSSAGARGLLQLMPATAKQTAKRRRPPLLQGAADHATRPTTPRSAPPISASSSTKFGGSYVMTFAAYNAGAEPRRRMGQALRRSARPEGRRGQLDRAHPLHRDAQLRPAHHGEPAGLPRPARRAGAHHRGRPEARRAD